MSFGSFVLLPNITGQIYVEANTHLDTIQGAFKSTYLTHGWQYGTNDTWSIALVFNARDSNSIYNKSNTVQPNSLVFNYIIKY